MLLLAPVAVAAQGLGLGVGPRLSFTQGLETATPDGSQRLTGGTLRIGAGRTATEIAFIYNRTFSDELLERVTSYPIQISLMVFPLPAGARFSPFVLGGTGWYSQKIQYLAPDRETVVDEGTLRRVGYHGGLGGELRLNPRFRIHLDYRYTFLHFGNPQPSDTTPALIPFAERFKISNEGSMWSWGATVFF